jgi:hypothetical protein
MSRLIASVVLLLGGLAAHGCGPSVHRNPVPHDLVYQAQVPGLEEYRFIGDDGIVRDMRATLARLYEARSSVVSMDEWKKPIRILSISGGGQNGAYGAGLLAGWSESGTRPTFQFVTGISTGALTAPMAFLGPDYDPILKRVYTLYDTADFIEKKGLLGALTSDSMMRVKGLKSVIDEFVNDDVVDAIAVEHRKGRRLWVGTTNLDANEPTFWCISGIASSDVDDRAALIRKILLASASIPVAFPPVYFEVEADGTTYDEMHVDGGVANQVFVYPLTVDIQGLLEQVIGQPLDDPKVYVIRNSRILPHWEATKPKILPIAARAMSSLISTQGVGDLYQIYLGCLRDDMDFNLARIPDSFDKTYDQDFDPVYMTALYELGYEHAKNGYAWEKLPPDYVLDANQLKQLQERERRDGSMSR